MGASIFCLWRIMFHFEYTIVSLYTYDVERYCIFLWERCAGGNGVAACFDGRLGKHQGKAGLVIFHLEV